MNHTNTQDQRKQHARLTAIRANERERQKKWRDALEEANTQEKK